MVATSIMAVSLILYLQNFSGLLLNVGIIGGAIILGMVVYVAALFLLKTFTRYEWCLLRKAMTE